MGNTKITIEFDAEKYKALQKFAGKKDIDIEKEITDTLDKLYLKTVPAAVREYIGD